MSSKKTQQHKLEDKTNKTIKLGYSSTKVYRCCHATCAAPACFQAVPSAKTKAPKCRQCGGASRLVRHVSFVDCPGHEALMATMLNGAAVMDAAILVVAANARCPQPQTAEHLSVMDVLGVPNIAVVQNKVELVSPEAAATSLEQIRTFVRGSVAEGASVIPASAQLGINIDSVVQWIAQLPKRSARAAAAPSRMHVVRSFDVNKPGTAAEDLRGGVAGGTVSRGTLRVGQLVEVRPGFVAKAPDGSFTSHPVITTIKSLKSERVTLGEARRGGLVGVGTNLDPSVCGHDQLVGQVVGQPGTLPTVYSYLVLMTHLMSSLPAAGSRSRHDDRKASSARSKSSRRKPGGGPRLRLKEVVRLHVNASNINGVVQRIDKHSGKAKIVLASPACVDQGQRVAISRSVDGQWRLAGYGDVRRGGQAPVAMPRDYDAIVARAAKEREPDASFDKERAPDAAVPPLQDNVEATAGAGPGAGAGAAAGPGVIPAVTGAGRSRDDGSTATPGATPAADAMLSYDVLHKRLRRVIDEKHLALKQRARVKLPAPELLRDGPKKTVWCNMQATATALSRPLKHLQSFVAAELSITTTQDGSGRTILSGHWKPQRIESIVRQYARKFVLCHQCRQGHTRLRHDADRHMDFLDCLTCRASCSLERISKGYKHVQRGERRARRAANRS